MWLTNEGDARGWRPPHLTPEEAGHLTAEVVNRRLRVLIRLCLGIAITRSDDMEQVVRDMDCYLFGDVYEYTGDPNNPIGDQISETATALRGPHPDLDGSLFCDAIVPYLQGP